MNIGELNVGSVVGHWRGAWFYHSGNFAAPMEMTQTRINVEPHGTVQPRPDKAGLLFNFTPAGQILEVDNVVNRYAAARTGEIINVERYRLSINDGTDVLTTQQLGADAAHLLADGDEVMVSALISMPGGLSRTTRYYARVTGLSGTTLSLHPTEADAKAGTNKVDITSAGQGAILHVTRALTLWTANGLKLKYWNVGLVKMPQLRVTAGQTLLGEMGFQAFVRNGQMPDDPDNRYYVADIEDCPDVSFDPGNIYTDSPTLTWNIGAPWEDGLATKAGATVDFGLELGDLPNDAFGADALGKTLKDRTCTIKAAVQGPNEVELRDALRLHSALRGARPDDAVDYALALATAGITFTTGAAFLTNGPEAYGSTDQRIGDLSWDVAKTFLAGQPNAMWALSTN